MGRESVGIPLGIMKTTLTAAFMGADLEGEKAGVRSGRMQEVIQGIWAVLVLLGSVPPSTPLYAAESV
jgi:hypothetical protein